MAAADHADFYDIVVLGSARGKSTLGDKLLQIKTKGNAFIEDYSTGEKSTESGRCLSFLKPISPPAQKPSLVHGCRLLANEETRIRVLDTPGLDQADSDDYGSKELFQRNQQILRSVANLAYDRQLKVRRVVYFLPIRGVPQKCDGEFKNQLKVISNSFGKGVFNCMVVVVTEHPDDEYQDLFKFNEKKARQTQKVVSEGLKSLGVSKTTLPAISLAYNENNDVVLHKIKTAKVIQDRVFLPEKPQQLAIDMPATTETHDQEAAANYHSSQYKPAICKPAPANQPTRRIRPISIFQCDCCKIL